MWRGLYGTENAAEGHRVCYALAPQWVPGRWDLQHSNLMVFDIETIPDRDHHEGDKSLILLYQVVDIVVGARGGNCSYRFNSTPPGTPNL